MYKQVAIEDQIRYRGRGGREQNTPGDQAAGEKSQLVHPLSLESRIDRPDLSDPGKTGIFKKR